MWVLEEVAARRLLVEDAAEAAAGEVQWAPEVEVAVGLDRGLADPVMDAALLAMAAAGRRGYSRQHTRRFSRQAACRDVVIRYIRLLIAHPQFAL